MCLFGDFAILGRTVNLMAYAFAGSNPAAPITPENPAICGVFVRLEPIHGESFSGFGIARKWCIWSFKMRLERTNVRTSSLGYC